MTGNRVRELRERFLLTQEALAFRCRVATRTAVAWEKGEKRPNSRNAKRLAKVLGVSVHELRLGGLTMAIQTPEQAPPNPPQPAPRPTHEIAIVYANKAKA